VRISDEERHEQQLASIPLYLAIGFLVRPPLREKSEGEIQSRRGDPAISCVGMQTVKSAVEPQTRAQWERLASYVRTGFEAQLLGAGGQQAIQYVSKLTTALLLLFEAYAVSNNDLTVGALVAFNMSRTRWCS
jgi:subfamily B ATP-binding cassette protein HlyB/CyaB